MQGVLVDGPGRAKILITADRDWRPHLDVIVESIAGLGGMACVNTTSVLCEGDPGPLARCVWVAALARADGLAPLRNSLVINAITGEDTLLDGFLADFLMRNEGFIRTSPAG